MLSTVSCFTTQEDADMNTFRELDPAELTAVAGGGGFYDENPGPRPAPRSSSSCLIDLLGQCLFRLL